MYVSIIYLSQTSSSEMKIERRTIRFEQFVVMSPEALVNVSIE